MAIRGQGCGGLHTPISFGVFFVTVLSLLAHSGDLSGSTGGAKDRFIQPTKLSSRAGQASFLPGSAVVTAFDSAKMDSCVLTSCVVAASSDESSPPRAQQRRQGSSSSHSGVQPPVCLYGLCHVFLLPERRWSIALPVWLGKQRVPRRQTGRFHAGAIARLCTKCQHNSNLETR